MKEQKFQSFLSSQVAKEFLILVVIVETEEKNYDKERQMNAKRAQTKTNIAKRLVGGNPMF